MYIASSSEINIAEYAEPSFVISDPIGDDRVYCQDVRDSQNDYKSNSYSTY